MLQRQTRETEAWERKTTQPQKVRFHTVWIWFVPPPFLNPRWSVFTIVCGLSNQMWLLPHLSVHHCYQEMGSAPHMQITGRTVFFWWTTSKLKCQCEQAHLSLIRYLETYLCFSLVVKCEDVVSSACLTLSDQEHSMSLRSRALNQVGCLDTGDGPMEPGVGEQEVISLLDNLLRRCKGDGAWRDEQRNKVV